MSKDHYPELPKKCPQCGGSIDKGHTFAWTSTCKWACMKCHIVGGPCEDPGVTEGREIAKGLKENISPLDKVITCHSGLVQIGILRELQKDIH